MPTSDKPTLHELAVVAMQAIISHAGYSDERRAEIARQAYDMAEAMQEAAGQRGHQRSPEFE